MQKRKAILVAITTAMLAATAATGCDLLPSFGHSSDATEESPEASPTPTETPDVLLASFYMTCGERTMRGEVFYDRVDVNIDGQEYALPSVVSADGAKFSDGHLTLWNRGNDWMEVNEETDTTVDCAVQ